MRQLQVSAFHTAFIFLNKLKKLTFNEKKKIKDSIQRDFLLLLKIVKAADPIQTVYNF